jgi:DNA-directed RNA polymerase specialized sigma24 family protein
MMNNFSLPTTSKEDSAVFHARFSRSYRLLYFIACRILGDPERIETAIENCWLSASRNPPRFEYEGEFRGWLLRVLIDEAVAICRADQTEPLPAESLGSTRPQRSGVPPGITAIWGNGAPMSELRGCR